MRIVVFREEGKFVAQCLEKDVCVQSGSLSGLAERMTGQLKLDRAETADNIPGKYFEMWKQGDSLELPDLQDHDVRIEHGKPIEGVSTDVKNV